MKPVIYTYLALTTAFLLGNHNGFIALWTQSDSLPDIVFPYSVTSLPRADQESINRGIHIRSEAELHAVLEDYLS